MRLIFIIGIIIYSFLILSLFIYLPKFLFYWYFLIVAYNSLWFLLSKRMHKILDQHPRFLFNNYEVYIKNADNSFYVGKNRVIISKKHTEDKDIFKYVLFHEIGHAIDEKELKYLSILSMFLPILFFSGYLSVRDLANAINSKILSFYYYFGLIFTLNYFFVSIQILQPLQIVWPILIFAFFFNIRFKTFNPYTFSTMLTLLILSFINTFMYFPMYLSLYYYFAVRNIIEIRADIYSALITKSDKGAIKLFKTCKKPIFEFLYFFLPYSTHPPSKIRIWIIKKLIS
ncbi:hypothetical protein SJAV_21580 [Sulfurisphaera javensis]|uniref:Peptidase M48 domain-containing protein n=1 Tax=Sulfurisphaera javensis TaxID=2049879 RepID=A0AAT9GTQ9_9CREN